MKICSCMTLFALVLGFHSVTQAQVVDYGNRSQASLYKNQITNEMSSSYYTTRQINRDKSAIGGFGVPTLSAPGGDTATKGSQLVSPAPRQSASFGVGSGSSTKPFSVLSSQPAVSPYLNLFRESFDGSDDLNYQTLVRPQLQQQSFNRQVEQQAMALNRQITAMGAKNAYNMTGNQGAMPTGHTATFQYRSHFYPQQQKRRR